MSKKLIICCDGTWNTPDQEDDHVLAPTNVYKLYNALIQDGNQRRHYQPGVGTEGLLDKLVGGTIGAGIAEDICECYQWLATNYKKGDHIFLFGFSRGAFAARSLAGMISKCGLLDFSGNERPKDISRAELVSIAYNSGYRGGEPQEEWCDGHKFHETDKIGHIPIEFIGVWDTVGALGVPDDKVVLNVFDRADNYRFHDVKLGKHIKQAYHAVAIDEKRGSFAPTLWDVSGKDAERITQLWFPGVHSDVGGGYKETGLSDGALKWMIDNATKAGLKFNEKIVEQIDPNPKDQLHNSHTGVMKVLVTAPRTIPDLDNSDNKVIIHDSVRTRRAEPPINQAAYRTTHKMVSGNSFNLDIYARRQWNWTGVYIEKGKTYRMAATGEWQDKSIPCGPGGTRDGRFHLGEAVHAVGTALGKLESLFKWFSKSEQADFIMTKRVEKFPWFSLIGAIADGGNPKPDGTHERLTYFNIGENAEFTAKSSGYLYCFANDAWGFYGNNRGFVNLTITKL